MPVYKNKTHKQIEYPQAPSGFINIEKWEPPFASVSQGFGFMGVLAEDSESGKLQCHECGQWFEQLPTHYSIKHGMSGKDYRKKFGLLDSTALKSKRIRLIQSQVMIDFRATGDKRFLRKFKRNNVEAANRKGKPKAVESQNKYGVCDLQIMTKIISLGKELGKTPTLCDVKNKYGNSMMSLLHQRYGSYIKYCRDYLKLTPNFSSFNPQFGSNKAWREHLLDIGKERLAEGRPLTVHGLLGEKGNPYTKETRYLYKYFKSFGEYKNKLLQK